jgi:hypothetical protein
VVRYFIFGVVAVLVAAFASPPAYSQAICGKHAQIARQLESDYSEKRLGLGLASNGAVLEVYTATDGNWTILMTFPDGRSCLMAEGEGWATTPAAATGPGV